MSDLTPENFRASILGLADTEGRKPQIFAQGLTLVPNTLLQAVVEEGVKTERERIINLLKNSAGESCETHVHIVNGSCLCDLIALIKGEN